MPPSRLIYADQTAWLQHLGMGVRRNAMLIWASFSSHSLITLRISGHARAVCGGTGRTVVAGVSEVGEWWGGVVGCSGVLHPGPGINTNQEMKTTKIYFCLSPYVAPMFEPRLGLGSRSSAQSDPAFACRRYASVLLVCEAPHNSR